MSVPDGSPGETCISGRFDCGGMSEAELFSIAVVGLLFGPPMAVWPYKMARWSEIIDAIGRRPAGRVEPADWKVLVTQAFGVLLALAGAVAAFLFAL